METAAHDQTIRRTPFAHQSPPYPLRAILVYEDVAAALRAQDLIHRLASELQPEFELSNEVWKFELLRHLQLKEEARAEAVEADLIIISAGKDTELPEMITSWIESWLADKVGRHTSLIALFNREEPSTAEADVKPQSAREYLRRAAEIGGMDFFCNIATPEWRQHTFPPTIAGWQRHRRGSSESVSVDLRPERPTRTAGNGF